MNLIRMVARGLVAAAALALLVGCMVGPNYVRPPAPTAAAFKEAGDWKPAQPSDAVGRGKWWEIFDDAKLNALVDQVNVSNENVRVAEARLRQAERGGELLDRPRLVGAGHHRLEQADARGVRDRAQGFHVADAPDRLGLEGRVDLGVGSGPGVLRRGQSWCSIHHSAIAERNDAR